MACVKRIFNASRDLSAYGSRDLIVQEADASRDLLKVYLYLFKQEKNTLVVRLRLIKEN